MRRGVGSEDCKTTHATTSTTPRAPTTGPRCRSNDTTRNTGRSDRQNAAIRHGTRRDERVTAQGPVKKLRNPTEYQKGGLCVLRHPPPLPPPPPPPSVHGMQPPPHAVAVER